MKRFVSVCFILLVAVLVSAYVFEAAAQTVKVKIEAMSPGRRSSGPPNFTAPTGPYHVSAGLRVVAKGMKVFVSADTTGSGSSAATSYAWSFTGKPANSVAVFDSASTPFTSFTADSTGTYTVQVMVNGTVSASTTILASTYVGNTSSYPGCETGCHTTKVTEWKATKHASIFARGISGQLEVAINGKGAYAKSCAKCHTTGWENVTDNGNFGYLATQSGWDTTWYQGLTLEGGDYWIPYQDSTLINGLPANMKAVGTIGCESCHGPGKDHNSQEANIGKSFGAGVCTQCHDAPKKHRIGSYWNASAHAAWPEGGHTGRFSCFPCHSGSAFAKWVGNKATPGYDTTTVNGQPSATSDANIPLTCVGCHDPHSESNPYQLRTVAFDSLANGWVAPAGKGGKGQLCMNCHHSRYNVANRVTTKAPYYGFVNNYGPHGSPQADMLFGQNGYNFGDNRLAGLNTHTGLEDACVTCHMAQRTIGSSIQSNHQWNMTDTTGDYVAACKPCHGDIVSFEEIKAAADYDGNGVIEGAMTEVEGLLARLKEKLPINTSTGEPTLALKDSLLVKDHPELVQGIYTYAFVKNDGSMGAHNTKYAVAILQKALGLYPADVKTANNTIPADYALKQNYPNPFNPTTTISFSLPMKENVKLEVYDVLGKLVKTLVNQDMAAGNFAITWMGDDKNGAKVSSGMYLYKLTAGSFSSVKKMVMLK
jgi:predicted CXXCH cytochrome family protein